MGNHRLDLLAALIQHTDYQLQTMGKGKAPPSDFLPKLPAYEKPKPKPEDAERKIRAGFTMLRAAFPAPPPTPATAKPTVVSQG